MAVHVELRDQDFFPSRLVDMYEVPALTSDMTDFYLLGFPGFGVNCQSRLTNQYYSVVASEDDTEITITPPSGQAENYVLSRFDVYTDFSQDDDVDFSGFRVNSSKPVTVSGGKICAFEETGGSYLTAHTPVERYEYVFPVPVMVSPAEAGYHIHVVAAEDNTIVTAEPNTYNLDAGEFELITRDQFYGFSLLSCSKPCYVNMYTIGVDNRRGMFQTPVVPTSDFYPEAVFPTNFGGAYDYIFTIVVDDPAAAQDLLLNEEPLSTFWTSTQGYTYADVEVPSGRNVVRSTQGTTFAVYTYAHYLEEGGGYGFAVLPNECKYDK